MKISKVFTFIFILLLPHSFASADWVWSPEQGKFINTESETQSGADDIFDNALDLYKEKKLDKAAEQFKIVLKQYPKSRVAPESQYRLGTIYEETGDYVEAHKAYQALIKSYPQSERFDEVIEREYQIGSMFLSGKKGKLLGLDIRPSLPLAIEVFQKIVTAAPYGAFGDKAQFNLGVAYQKSGQFDNSVEAFQALIDQYPQSDLVQQARLRMAEVAFAKSGGQARDQSALDEASRQAQSYLKKYPGSEEAEEAEKISRKVDELNAEKNYRIGLYYEKDNYLTSALIYYSDTAKRYPNTAWGQKASEKLHSLQEPVKYLNAKAEELQKELGVLEAKYQALGKGQKTEREQLKKEIAKMKKRIKAVHKNKVESLERRKKDLKRRERELNEKFKEFERKKKRFKNNTSPEFQKAMNRWLGSLEAERDALAEEKGRLESWRSELGISDAKFYENLIPSNLIPFMGQSETPLQKIQRMDEKEFYKLSRKKKELLEKKEKLYKRYSELQLLLVPERSKTGLKRKRLRGVAPKDPTKPTDPKLLAREKDIEALEAKLDAKMALYEKYFGKSAEQELEAVIESRSAQKAAFNPFTVDTGDIQKKSIEELLELKMHLTEQIKAQEDIINTLSTAFDKELALREQRAMMKSLDDTKEVDVRKLRKKTKRVEKELRKRYQDIQDRQKNKKKLLAELDETLNPREGKGKVLRTLAKPVTGPVYLVKAFIFGLPNEDVTLTKAAKKPGADAKAKTLQEGIELESLMIQAQAEEINKLEKELEILTAKASLSGGVKFRTSFVKVPYTFIEEAVQSARRVVPRKSRKDVLLNRLDKQTQELDRFTTELEATEAAIKEKTPAVVPPSDIAATGTAEEEKEKAEPAPNEKQLRTDAMNLREQLEISYSIYAQEQGVVLGDAGKQEAPTDTEGAKRYKEYKETGAELVRVIDQELEIEQQEGAILEKRIAETDKVMPTVTSKAMQQDLETEKDRIGQRLSDLATRHDFLSKEKERFSGK
ncbi:MAG: outer membrane protein assembly factor BamD [Candidatus Omnitrophica bacterium]|nr:outer membrane protein assembly factor BamD [Candidatus Omnitrophota bacterium]